MFLDTAQKTPLSYSGTLLRLSFCPFVCGVFFASLGLLSVANATTINLDYDVSFGATPPDGPAPYASSTFDDANSPGTVTLTVEVAATVNDADVSALYINLDPNFDPTSLSIVRTGGTGPAAGDINIFTGVNAFQADGDGKYDILIDLPPPPGQQAKRFQAGENLIFAISGIPTLTASSFDFFAAPSGGAGPFLSVARFLSTGVGGEDSDWVGAVPEPGTLVLSGLGLVALVVCRRRHLT